MSVIACDRRCFNEPKRWGHMQCGECPGSDARRAIRVGFIGTEVKFSPLGYNGDFACLPAIVKKSDLTIGAEVVNLTKDGWREGVIVRFNGKLAIDFGDTIGLLRFGNDNRYSWVCYGEMLRGDT